MTKEQIRSALQNGCELENMLEIKESKASGVPCMIVKEPFSATDDIIYMPDLDLNRVAYTRPIEDPEEIERMIDLMYTGNDFMELCSGYEKLARYIYDCCDWQSPSTEMDELENEIIDGEIPYNLAELPFEDIFGFEHWKFHAPRITTHRCACGSKKFWAHRVYHLDVEVDEHGEWVKDEEVYDCGNPYGPYICKGCGKEYSDFSDIPYFHGNDVVLVEHEAEMPYSTFEIEKAMSACNNSKTQCVFTLSIEGDNSIAEGFITSEAADFLDYNPKNYGFSARIASIMNDMKNETKNHVYDILGMRVVLVRDADDISEED